MNEEELPTQPETTPEEAMVETASNPPPSVPDEPPPASESEPVPEPAITPEAEPTPVAEVAPEADAPVCTAHTVVTYDGPSDVLILRIKRGERFLVTPELDAAIDGLRDNGHSFTLAD